MNLLILFIILNVVNVILQTAKSIATVKCGKFIASIINAIAYGLYTIVIIYTNSDLPLFAKVAVVAISNLIGVYVVKVFEEKIQKERVWRIEVTVKDEWVELNNELFDKNISHNLVKTTTGERVFNCYSNTKAESKEIKKILEKYNAKYFVTESKIL